MDHFEAFDIVKRSILQGGDELAIEALRVLTALPPVDPPGDLGGVGRSARQLAQQIHKTGGHAPARHSAAMERLIHRLTILLEAFLDLYEGERQPVDQALPAAEPEAALYYQISYCDDCGAELSPEGTCQSCDNQSTEAKHHAS